MKKLKSLACFAICVVILLQAVSFTVFAGTNDVTGIDDGKIYRIRNVNSKLYLTVYSNTNANGQNVIGGVYSRLAGQQWKAIRQSDGTYRFQTMISGTVRYLDVTSGNVDIWTDAPSYQKFGLVRLFAGPQGGTYYIKFSSNYVYANASNDVKVGAGQANNEDLWSFELVEKGCAEYFSHKEAAYDYTLAAAYICPIMTSMGYSSYNMQYQYADVALFYMTYADIWVFRGHGNAGVVAFFDQSGNSRGNILANSNITGFFHSRNDFVDSLSTNELANARCVLYIACSTGKNATGSNGVVYNLVTSTYVKGAHFVLGLKEDTSSSANDKWVKAFFDKAATGAPTLRLIDYIDYANNQQDFRNVIYYVGDTYQTLY